jgi:hypothetical protein
MTEFVETWIAEAERDLARGIAPTLRSVAGS